LPTVSLGQFDGRVAAVVKEFVCTTPNQDEVFFHPCRKEKFTSVPIFDMALTILPFGHNPGSLYIVT